MSERAELRILMTADAVGGVWQYAIDLARGLGAFEVETVIALMGPYLSSAQRAMAAAVPHLTLVETGLELDWLAPTAGAVTRAGRVVSRLAEAHDVDLVHLNIPALAARTPFPVPVVAVTHGCTATWWKAMHGEAVPAEFAWRVRLTDAGLHAADQVIAPTAAFADATMACYRLRERPIVVHNGRSRLALPATEPGDFAFTAGRLWDQTKNLRLLDRVAAILPVPFIAAGPVRGPHGETVTLEHIRCVGALEEPEVARCLAARPVFVTGACYEPFGLAVLEAAAAGCALVLSDIPTFRELWNGAAVFISPDDHAGYADAIVAILSDGRRRRKLGEAARARAARYTPAAAASAMTAIYRELHDPVIAARPAASTEAAA
jgi:glycosyltransferase involved in cell wall biosynthesis